MLATDFHIVLSENLLTLCELTTRPFVSLEAYQDQPVLMEESIPNTLHEITDNWVAMESLESIEEFIELEEVCFLKVTLTCQVENPPSKELTTTIYRNAFSSLKPGTLPNLQNYSFCEKDFLRTLVHDLKTPAPVDILSDVDTSLSRLDPPSRWDALLDPMRKVFWQWETQETSLEPDHWFLFSLVKEKCAQLHCIQPPRLARM